MKLFSTFTKGIVAMLALASTSALAATFVYVSNAEDGEIGAYAMQADGALKPLARTQAGQGAMPKAASPNRRPLYPPPPSTPPTRHGSPRAPGTAAPHPPLPPPPTHTPP